MLDSPFGRFVLRLGPLKGKIGEDEYLAVCQLNEPLVIERNQEGDWEIQSLNGAIDSLRNAALTRAVADWAKKMGPGLVSCFYGIHLAERRRSRTGSRLDSQGEMGDTLGRSEGKVCAI